LGNETTAIMINGTTLEILKNIFNPSDAAQEPKIISDRNSQDIYSDPGILKPLKCLWQTSSCD
jgi:hypothetical protein